MRRLLIVLVGLSVMLLLMAAGQPEEEGEIADVDDHLIVANFDETQSMDPHAVEDTPSHWINNQIYDGLVRRTDDMGVEPALAEDWEFIDDRTVEFYLREDVTFHDGGEFTASDVKYTYQRLLDPDENWAGASRLSMVDYENIEVVDDYTVRIPTYEPFAAILTYLAHSSSLIISESAAEEHGDNFFENPVGTGPFMLDEWERGSAVHLRRFDDHWRGPAEVERLTFRAVPEDGNRTIELETGGVHVAQELPETDLHRLRDNENVELFEYEALRLNYLVFNSQMEPFDNQQVRQALHYAVDHEELAEVAFGDLGSPAQGFMNSSIFGFNPDVYMYPRDMERAEELLDEAGYGDGFEMTISINDDDERQTMAEILASQWRELGIDVSIEVMEWGAFLDYTAAGNHDFGMLAWLASTGDPHHALYSNAHSSNIGAANRAHIDNAEIDELLEQGQNEPDQDRRAEIYGEVQELLSDYAAWIPIADDREAVGIQSNVTGFRHSPSGYHMFHEVGLE